MDSVRTKTMGRPFATRTAAFLLLSILTVGTIQYWWWLPLENLGSPADIFELILGLTLALACLVVGFRAEPRSTASRVLTAMAGLFAISALIEYFADAGPIDIPISFLWLAPALTLALTRIASGHSISARLSFSIALVLQLAEVGRSILTTVYYGGIAEPPAFEWIESASDLLVRAFLLLGFVEALRLPASASASGLHRAFAPAHPYGRRKHVAIFMYRLSGGGAQRRSVTLANGLAAQGYDVDYVVINDSSKIKDQLSPRLRFIALNSPQWGGLHAALYRRLPFRIVRIYLGAAAFARYLLAESPGAIIAGSNRVLLSAVIARQLSGRSMPLVLRATNFPSGNLNLWAPLRPIVDFGLGCLLRLIYPSATVTVAVADGVAEEVVRLSAVAPERVVTIFEPVLDETVVEKSKAPLAHPWFSAGEPPVLLGVGHLRMQKDFPTLIRAFALARKKRRMRLVLLGEGSQRPRLQSIITSLGVADDVYLAGHTENPFSWMARASLFVLSSAWEGLPAVLIEAMACGCPVVSTNCPSGPWEILDGGKYGRLVPCRDPQGLADAIIASLDAPVSQQVLIDRAQLFSAKASVDQYVDILEACHSRNALGR